jgi:hypothetical protein
MVLARSKFMVVVVAVLATAAAIVLIARTSASGLTPPPSGEVIVKVSICHSTGSQQNPYVINEPDASGDVQGHAGHTGPVWTPGASSWGDIIPPFTYSGGTFAGLNWTAQGQAIYANDCEPVDTPPTTAGPPPTTGGPSPTTGGPSPTTGGPSPTTAPGGTTTPATGGATPTVSPGAATRPPTAVVAQPRTTG